MRRLIVWMALWFFFPLALVAAPAPASQNFLDDAGALQTKLREWQPLLTNLDLGAGPVTDAERSLINQDRSAALAAIELLNNDINELAKSPGIDGEARLVLHLNLLQGKLSNLSDSLGAVHAEQFFTLHSRLPPSGEPVHATVLPAVQQFYQELNLQLMKQFNAVVTVGAANAPNAPHNGEISGHIYRADTAKPLAGATVVLAPMMPPDAAPLSTQSGEDGSYDLTALPPGTYTLSAHKAGFARAAYGFNKAQGGWTPLTLTSGEQNRVVRGPSGAIPPVAVNGKLANIDLKLNPVPEITEMNGDALLAADLEERVFTNFQFGSFSPDGKFFAVTTGDPDPHGGWFYDLNSQRLSPVTPPDARDRAIISMGWAGDTLYVESGQPNGPHDHFYSATVAGAKALSELPPEGQEALKERLGYENGEARNSRFIVTAQNQGHGEVTLTAKTADGGESFTIAGGSWGLQSYMFLPERSLVVYPAFFYPAIVVYDLNVRKGRETWLPVRAERLLAVRPQAGGLFIAYTTRGPCDSVNPHLAGSLEPRYRPTNVCFATIPLAGEE